MSVRGHIFGDALSVPKYRSTGRAAAKTHGVKFGRPSKISAKNRNLAMRLFKEVHSVRDVAETFDVHTSTIYRLLNS
jgi:DNA invertase Pin-like site-specific DNA recombinase